MNLADLTQFAMWNLADLSKSDKCHLADLILNVFVLEDRDFENENIRILKLTIPKNNEFENKLEIMISTYGFWNFTIQRKTIWEKTKNFGNHDFENENIRILKPHNSKK